MVDKYMVKLIPRSHRIFMPQYEDYHGKPLEVKHVDQEGSKSGKQTQFWEFASVRQAVPQLIFWKTRYLFYNSYARESYIVPSNLRELRQLIKLLILLPDYRIYGENAEGKETVLATNWSNKDLFKNYFFETWLNNHLPADLRDDAQRILGEARDGNLNAMVYDLLDERYELTTGIKQAKLTMSFGDVLSVIHKLEQRLSSAVDLKYLFFIKSLYSMKFYEAYDLMTEDENHRIQRNHDEIFIDDDTKFALNTPYQMLSGISLFNTGDYIPSMGYSIDNEKLNTLISSCIEQFNGLPAAKRTRNKKLKELELRVKWAELLMLCTNSLDKDILDFGTMFSRLPYLYASDKRQYVFFENSDIFFKTLDFTTLGDDFRTSTIKHRLNGDAKAFTVQRWQSFCTIRNVEVLEGFLSTVKSGTYTLFDRYENLRTFFTKASEFDVKTYDRDETGREPYSIHFRFLEKVLDLLSETDKPAYAALKAEIISILGDVSENSSEIENNGNPGAVDSSSSDV